MAVSHIPRGLAIVPLVIFVGVDVSLVFECDAVTLKMSLAVKVLTTVFANVLGRLIRCGPSR